MDTLPAFMLEAANALIAFTAFVAVSGLLHFGSAAPSVGVLYVAVQNMLQVGLGHTRTGGGSRACMLYESLC